MHRLDPARTPGGFIENLPGYGEKLAARYDRQYQLLPGETIIVISNSGKNSAPLEVALYAKKKGLTVVGPTAVSMSSIYATVHPGKKNLHAVADYVLDNGGVPGDAIVEVAPGIMLDYDAAGNVIGIEVLDVRERVAEQRGKAA